MCIKGKDTKRTKKELLKELEKEREKVSRLEEEHKKLKEIKKELKAERDKFRSIISSMSDGFDIIDKNYRICFQNKMLKDRFGDLTGKVCFEAYMKRKTPCEICLVQKSLKTGKTQKFELLAPDSKIYELTSTPFKDTDGETKVLEIIRDITEHKEREKEYKNLIDGMNDTAFVINFEGKFIDVNDTAVEFLGYSREELLSMGPTDIDPVLSEKDIKGLIEGMKMGEKQVFETAHKTKSGNIIPVEVSSSLVTYKGKPAILSITRDISERKKAEEQLREREEQLSAIFNNTSDLQLLFSLEKDGELRAVNVNKTAISTARRLGLDVSKESFLGKTVRNILKYYITPAEKDTEEVYKMFRRTAETGKPTSYEETYDFGNRFYSGEVTVLPLLDKSGKCSRVLWSSHDITDRKKAEELLKESEGRFQTVIENLPDEIFVHGLDGKFILVNKASCEKSGYTKEELLNMKVGDIDRDSVSRDDRKNIWQKLQKKGGFELIETTHYRKDGSSYPAEIYFGTVTFKGSPMIIGIAHDITERKKAIGELRESEERFQTVIENLPHGVCLHDLNGKMTLVNKALCKMTGYSEKEMLNMKVQEVDHECATRDDRHNLWLKLNKGGHDYVESTLYRKDGSTFPGVIYLNAINLKEEPMILAITQDITERKKAMEKLKESEERFQTIIENLPHAVSLHDLDGNFVLVNEALCKQTGYTRDEYMKMKVGDVDRLSQTRDDRKKIWLKLNKGGHTHFESELSCKDGSRYPVEIYINAISLESEPMILAIAQDISDRKKALESLQKSEEKYRNLYDSMIEAFARTNMEGNIIEFNKQYLDMLGYNDKEIKSLKYTDFTPEKWHEMEMKTIEEQVIKRGYSDVYEKEYIKKDGTIFPVELRTFLLRDDDGNPNGMWAIVRDITERKKMEEEIRKIERLESLGILAGGIAHDFNNLLTGILGNLSLAQMSEGEDFLNILEEAKQASIQAKNLTQQLLTFSKGGEPIKGKVSIEDIIRESAEFSLHGSNVRCEFDFPDDLWKVEVDKGQMSQVIDNLVINSNQAMPEGGKIHIKAANIILSTENLLYLPEGKYVKITLQDEGIGVPDEYLSRIFDPYFSTKQEGSGLGLATVYSIIQRHEGYITVQSKAGDGTTFFIYLPAIEEKTAKRGEKKAIRRTLKGEGRILIMDDEKIVRRAVGGMLGRLGYTVESAENGEEAISKYKEAMNSEKLFDAVILDLTVPGGMGGKKTIEKLLKIDPNVKAIVSSGYSTDPVMANYEKYGFKAVVAKPFDLKELNEAIKKVLE